MISINQILARVRQEKQNQEVTLLNQNSRIKQIADLKQVEIQQNKQKIQMLEAQLHEQQNLNQQLSKLTNEQQNQQFHKSVQNISLMKIHVTSLNTLLQQLKEFFLIESNKILSNLRVQVSQNTGLVAQAERFSRLPELMKNAQANRNLAIQVRPTVQSACQSIKGISTQLRNEVFNKQQRLNLLFEQMNIGFEKLYDLLRQQNKQNNIIEKQVEENQALVIGVAQKLRAKKDQLVSTASQIQQDVQNIKIVFEKLKNIKPLNQSLIDVSNAVQKLTQANSQITQQNNRLQSEIDDLKKQINQQQQKNNNNSDVYPTNIKKEQIDQLLYKLKLLKEDQKQLKEDVMQKKRAFLAYIDEQGAVGLNWLNSSAQQVQGPQINPQLIKQQIEDIQQVQRKQLQIITNKLQGMTLKIQRIESYHSKTLSELKNSLLLFKLDLQNVKEECVERTKHFNFNNIVQRTIASIRDLYENDSNICTIQHYDKEISQIRYAFSKFKSALELCKLQMQRMSWDHLFKDFNETLFNAVMAVVKVQDRVTKRIVEQTSLVVADSNKNINNSLSLFKNFNYCINLDIQDCNKKVTKALSIMCARRDVVQRFNELQDVKQQINDLRNLVSSQKSAFTYKFIGEANIIMNQLIGTKAAKQSNESPTMDIQKSIQMRFVQKDVKDELLQLKQDISNIKKYIPTQLSTSPPPNWPMRLSLQINQVFQQKLQNELKDMMNISVGAGELQQENQKLQQEVSAVLTEKSGLQDELKVANSRLDQQLKLNMDLQRKIEDLLNARDIEDAKNAADGKSRPPRPGSNLSFRSTQDDEVNGSDRILVGKSNPSLSSIKTLMSLQSDMGNVTQSYENVSSWTVEQFTLRFSDRKTLEGNRLVPSVKKLDELRIQICTDVYKQGLFKDIEYKLRHSDVMSLDGEDAPGLAERPYFFDRVVRRILRGFGMDFKLAKQRITQILHIPTGAAATDNVLYDTAIKNYILQQYDFFLEDYLCNSVFIGSSKILKSAFHYKLRKKPTITFPSINEAEELDVDAYLIRILILLFLAEAEPVNCKVDAGNMMIVFPELKIQNYKLPALQVKMK